MNEGMMRHTKEELIAIIRSERGANIRLETELKNEQGARDRLEIKCTRQELRICELEPAYDRECIKAAVWKEAHEVACAARE